MNAFIQTRLNRAFGPLFYGAVIVAITLIGRALQ